MSPPTPGQARRARRVSHNWQLAAEANSYRIIGSMRRTALYLKVEIDHDTHQSPQQLAGEVCRRLMKMHGVRAAELSSFVSQPQEEASAPPPATSS
jgi:hypothetical protein